MEEFRAIAVTQEAAHRAITAGYAHAKALLTNGERVVITVTTAVEPISIRQRRFYHGAVLQQISEQAVVNGTRYVIEAWKELMRRMFLPDTWKMQRLPGAKKATPIRIRSSTETLGPRAYSELIEQVLAYGATELGVNFVFDIDERDGVRYHLRKKQKTEEASSDCLGA